MSILISLVREDMSSDSEPPQRTSTLSAQEMSGHVGQCWQDTSSNSVLKTLSEGPLRLYKLRYLSCGIPTYVGPNLYMLRLLQFWDFFQSENTVPFAQGTVVLDCKKS
jgi:hypothetical protein